MIRAVIISAALLLLAAPGARADWQEELTPQAGGFPPLRPFRAHYRFGWTMFTAAEADFDLSRKKDVTRLVVSAHTIGVVRSMWRMDAEHTARMHTSTFRPISLVQTEVYKDETEKVKVDFSAQGVARRRESSAAKDPPKTKKFEFPNIHDLHSALQFVRSQALADGDVYKLVVYPATAPYLTEVEVTGHEKVKAAGATRPAIRINLKLARIEDDLTLRPHDKFKRATVWISDDEDRMILRLEAEIFVGTVWGELEKAEFPRK